jgi:hypothetical protein
LKELIALASTSEMPKINMRIVPQDLTRAGFELGIVNMKFGYTRKTKKNKTLNLRIDFCGF